MHIRVMPLIWIAFGITNTKIIIIQFVFIGYIILTGYIITIRFVYEYIWINTFDNYIQIVSDCWGKRQMKQKQGNYHSSPFDCNNLGSQNITMTIKRDTHRRLNTHTQTHTHRHTALPNNGWPSFSFKTMKHAEEKKTNANDKSIDSRPTPVSFDPLPIPYRPSNHPIAISYTCTPTPFAQTYTNKPSTHLQTQHKHT